ncbi:hypothetical protein HPB48_007100 [Haemaphysalis longicornis]|uniref:ISXO2-like transposase domain-containing protein n=1 Tax=Haemaphysalis longicornis TaxID=44386 RepID=A0A9J6FRD6_HAELO|nr:hypothetical protein HPB48_007100 [Haemaphysalis longicornis]
MASPRYDPNLAELNRIFDDPNKEEEFLRQLGLSATPNAVRPARLESAPGRPSNNEYWGICKDVKFNPSFPDCVGQVVTYQRKTAEGRRPQFRCSGCRKQLSQLNGSNVLRGLPGQGSFFAFTDRLGRPNVRLTRKEIMWLAFSLCKDMPVALTKELMRREFALSKQVLTDWRNLLREVVQEELRARPPLGGPNQVVQVDECLMRGKRKGNRGRLLTGDGVTRSTVDKGPWVFGMVCVETKEVRLFKVDAQDAVTLGEKITQNIAPGTTIHSDEWAAYNCIPNLVDAAGSSMNYVWKTVNHTNNFVDPNTGTHTQNIESFWQKARRRLGRNGNKVTSDLLECHLLWLWWLSMNGRSRCKDTFLRLLEAIARQYPA